MEVVVKNHKFLIDEQDFEIFNKFSWSLLRCTPKHIYLVNSKNSRDLFHRLVMNPKEGLHVDHISRDTTDNRRSNLRVCTRQQNMFNRGVQKNNASGFKGVYFDNQHKRWVAKVEISGKKIRRSFLNLIDAVNKYNELARKYFGEFAYLNFIPK